MLEVVALRRGPGPEGADGPPAAPRRGGARGRQAVHRAAPPRVQLRIRAEAAVPLESYRGRLAFVNFWATWCGPCLAEMPSLIALQRSLDPADIAFVSISEDDEWPPVDACLRRDPLPFDVSRDRPPRVEPALEVSSYPTSFLIGRDGRALSRFHGGRDWDTRDVRDLRTLQGTGPLGPPR